MANPREHWPDDVRDYVVTQALGHGKALKPLIERINAGREPDCPKCAVALATARGWVSYEQRKLDAAAALDSATTRKFRQRLFAVGMAELRKLERDSRRGQSIDIKRLNDLEAFVARCERHLTGPSAKTATPGKPSVASEDRPLLERLAATTEPNPKPSTAETTPHTTPKPSRKPVVASDRGEEESTNRGDLPSPALSAA